MSATSASSRRYRARIAPRGSSNRGLASRIQWDKVGRVALVLVLFAVLISYIKPTIALVQTWSEAGAAREHLAELKTENARLQARAEELKTPAAAIREARKLGLVGAGEQAYVIRGLD